MHIVTLLSFSSTSLYQFNSIFSYKKLGFAIANCQSLSTIKHKSRLVGRCCITTFTIDYRALFFDRRPLFLSFPCHYHHRLLRRILQHKFTHESLVLRFCFLSFLIILYYNFLLNCAHEFSMLWFWFHFNLLLISVLIEFNFS